MIALLLGFGSGILVSKQVLIEAQAYTAKAQRLLHEGEHVCMGLLGQTQA
jgi:hypothetical protein